MSKRIIATLLSIAMLMSLLCTSALAATNADLVVTGANGGIRSGDTITATVTVPSVSDVASGFVKVLFKNVILNATNITAPEKVSDASTTVTTVSTANSVGYVSISVGNGVSKNITMDAFTFSITFTVKSDAPIGNVTDLIKINLENGYYFEDKDGDSVTAPTFTNSSFNTTILKAPITNVTFTLATPEYGKALPSLTDLGTGYNGKVQWYEGTSVTGSYVSGNAKEHQIYTARIILTAIPSESFATAVTTPAGYSVESKASDKIVLTMTFPVTAGHEHSWSTDWETNGTHHWHNCTVSGCTAKDAYGAHDGTATCIAKAHCSICNTDYGNTVPANHPNALIPHAAVTATCTNTGNVAYWHCDACNNDFDNVNGTGTPLTTTETSIDPNNHIGTLTWVAVTGGHQQKYDGCNHTVGNVNPHTYVNGICSVCHDGCKHTTKNPVTGTAATCCADGVKDHYVCADCGTKFLTNAADAAPATTEDLTAPKIPHTFSALIDESAATCTKTGTKAHETCTQSCCAGKFFDKDGNEITDGLNIPALGHDYTTVAEVPATCATKGTKAHRTCSRCPGKMFALNSDNEVTSDVLTIPALGHKFTTGEGNNTKPNYVPAGTGRFDITLEQLECVNCHKPANECGYTGSDAFKASLPINVSLNVQKDATSISNPPAKVQFIFALYKAGDERPIVNGTFAETTGNANETLTGTGVFEGKPANDVTTAENNLLDALPTENTPWTVKQTSVDMTNWTIDRTEYKIAFVQSGDSLILRVLDNAPETDPATPGGEVLPTSDIVAFTNIYKAVKQDDPPTPTPVIPDGPKHTNRRYPAKPAASTDTKKPDGVNSARTFDAGVALYVGMSVLSLTGTALVIGKKKEF